MATQAILAADVPLPTFLTLPLGLAVVAFWCWAPGRALLGATRWPGREMAAIGVSLAILALGSGLAVLSGVWHPRAGTALVAVVTGCAAWLFRPFHGRHDRQRTGTKEWIAQSRTALGTARMPAVLLAAAMVLWLVSLPLIDVPRLGRWGLLISGPPTFGISLALVVAAFLAALRLRRIGWMWAALLGAVLVERGTGALVLDAPSVDWAYKHLGVVDLFVTHGKVDWGLDIYQGWPSFFSAVGTLQEASGISAFELAKWFTLAVTVATVLAVRALARSLGADESTALTAAGLALVVNWVYQDYFSPQALALVLSLVVLTLVFRRGSARRVPVLALLVFAAVVTTHQLTPVWLLGAVIALTVLRRVPWWLTAAMIVLLAGQVALNIDVIRGYGLFSQFDVVSNARTTAAFDLGSEQLDWHSRANHVATFALWGASALVAAVGLWRRRWCAWSRSPRAVAAVLAFSPFAILLAQSYGGEAVLRVMLFSIPGCALLLAPPVVRWITGSRLTALAASVFVFLLTASAGHAYFSTFGHYAVTRTEYRVASMLEREVPGKAYLAPMSSYWPVRPTAAYAWRLRDDPEFDTSVQNKGSGIRSNDFIPRLEEYLENRDAPTYLEFNSRMDAYADYRGITRRGSIDALRAKLAARDGWETIWDRGGVTVLRYVPKRTADQPAARWQP